MSTAIKVAIQTGLEVQVFQDKKYEFLMTTQEVANGYEVTPNSLRKIKSLHHEELAEGYHFVRGASMPNIHTSHTDSLLWTKVGIIRLGFFVRSGRAKVFRDWAEKVILDKLTGQSAVSQQMELPLQTEAVRVLPNKLYEELMTIDSKAKRLRLMKFYKEIAAQGKTL